jgi:hypothetical protein
MSQAMTPLRLSEQDNFIFCFFFNPALIELVVQKSVWYNGKGSGNLEGVVVDGKATVTKGGRFG